MIVEKAYLDMYQGGKLGDYHFSVKYSGKFNDYNANVTKNSKNINFKLSKKWRGINEDIRIGLIQHLFNKILKTKVHTDTQDLYNIFMKKVHVTVKKNKIDPFLLESFNRVNEKYFYGLIEQTNLIWGNNSLRKLGHYEYGTDSISISTIFEKGPIRLLDFVMYHEMLHKKHKFNSKHGRSHYHTSDFLKEEKKYESYDRVEKEMEKFIRKL